MEYNEDPVISGSSGEAEERRMMSIFFPTVFTSDEKKLEIAKSDPNTIYRKANVLYTTDAFQTKIPPMFLHMLLNVYKIHLKADGSGLNIVIPPCIKKHTVGFLDDQDQLLEIFSKKFVFKTSEETLKVKEIWKAIETKCLNKKFKYKKLVQWLQKRVNVYKDSKNDVYMAEGVAFKMDDEEEDE